MIYVTSKSFEAIANEYIAMPVLFKVTYKYHTGKLTMIKREKILTHGTDGKTSSSFINSHGAITSSNASFLQFLLCKCCNHID